MGRANEFLVVSALLAASLAASTPADCFKTSNLINSLGDEVTVVADTDKIDLLTSQHRLTKIEACFTDERLVGLQTTYGVF